MSKMLSDEKKTHFNSYARWTLRNLFASQFLCSSPDSLVRIKRLHVNIQARKNKKIFYFYLWFLTKQHPYATRFNLAQKNLASNNFLQTKPKRQRLEVDIKNKNIFVFLHEILWQVIIKQTNAEKKVWSYQKLNLLINMYGVPLTQKTLMLQGSNNYLSYIPLKLQFRFSCTTAFEKLFFLRALKFLSQNPKLKALDSFQ